MSVIIFRGEDPTLTITVTTDGSTGFNLTGATMETRFQKKSPGQELILANSAHTLDGDQSTNPGKFTLALTADQTETLKIGEDLVVVIAATISSAVTKFELLVQVKPGNTVETK